MAVRLGMKLRNDILDGSCLRNLLRGGIIHIYSGVQPASADSAESGTLLVKITDTKADYTGGTAATADIQLTGGSAGSIDTVVVGDGIPLIGSAVDYVTGLNETATALAAAINAYANVLGISAVAVTDTVTLSMPLWMGVAPNATALTVTKTTLTTTEDSTFTSGADATAGLAFAAAASAGTLTKDSATWQGTGLQDGTAGWFRWYDADYVTGADTTACHMDGSAGTSASQLLMSSAAIQDGVDVTVNSVNITEPAS